MPILKLWIFESGMAMATLQAFMDVITDYLYDPAYIAEPLKTALTNACGGERAIGHFIAGIIKEESYREMELSNLSIDEASDDIDYNGVRIFSSSDSLDNSEAFQETINQLVSVIRKGMNAIDAAAPTQESVQETITALDDASEAYRKRVAKAESSTQSYTFFAIGPSDAALTRYLETPAFKTFQAQIHALYEQAFNDQLRYPCGDLFNEADRLYPHISLFSPAKEMNMVYNLISNRSHTIQREGIYLDVSQAVLQLTSSTPSPPAALVDPLINVLVSGYENGDNTSDKITISKAASSAGGAETPQLPLHIETEEAEAFLSTMEQDYYVASIQHSDINNLITTLLADLEQLEQAKDIVLEYKDTGRREQLEKSYYEHSVTSASDKRRFEGLKAVLKRAQNSADISLPVLAEELFKNGSLVFIANLDNHLKNIMIHPPGGTQDYALQLRVLSALEVIKNQYIQTLEKSVTNSDASSHDVPSSNIAIVDQFPLEDDDVVKFGAPTPDPDHGVTVATLADSMGGASVQVRKYASETTADKLKACFDTLANDPNIQVVNFSSALTEVTDAEKDMLCSAFWNLCQSKDVVVALGNNAKMINADNELSSLTEEGGLPHIENFFIQFTAWLKENGKQPEEIEALKLIICENYRMDVNARTERSSTIAQGHPLASKVVGVRADCVVNPVTNVLESGTSYAAPIVAGALASVENRDLFRQKMTKADDGQRNITTWTHLSQASRERNHEDDMTVDAVEASAFEVVAELTRLRSSVLNIGSVLERPIRPHLSQKDQNYIEEVKRAMEQIIPKPGEAGIV
ncbi:MAG: S8/S53 family peptidase [Legionellaceae bacterium]|nr:S8/S53 family peptidase [Legionellaceae bacterium]